MDNTVILPSPESLGTVPSIPELDITNEKARRHAVQGGRRMEYPAANVNSVAIAFPVESNAMGEPVKPDMMVDIETDPSSGEQFLRLNILGLSPHSPILEGLEVEEDDPSKPVGVLRLPLQQTINASRTVRGNHKVSLSVGRERGDGRNDKNEVLIGPANPNHTRVSSNLFSVGAVIFRGQVMGIEVVDIREPGSRGDPVCAIPILKKPNGSSNSDGRRGSPRTSVPSIAD